MDNPAVITRRRIPLWIKFAYTAFVAVLVPVYWVEYGPSNFLYFCDIALLMTVPALWLECSLLASAPLVGILIPQLLWQIDFLAEVVGVHVTGMTTYMFQFNSPFEFLTRFLSFFHFWLPILLIWVVCRLGYDRRAFVTWTLLAWIILVVCYVWMPGPDPNDQGILPININYVYGFSSKEPQPWMNSDLYFVVFTAALTLIFWGTHCALRAICPMAETGTLPPEIALKLAHDSARPPLAPSEAIVDPQQRQGIAAPSRGMKEKILEKPAGAW